MPELKPCPFCGEPAELSKGGRVCCPAGDDCPAGFIFAAPDDWNRRAIPADQVLVPRELLEQIEISLRSEIEERYAATKDHPAIRQKYLRDIAEADELRAILQR